MEGYSEFFNDNGELVVHVELYAGNAVHSYDYRVDEVQTKRLAEQTNVDGVEGLLRLLTARFSVGNGVIAFFEENGIKGKVENKEYADTSSDV